MAIRGQNNYVISNDTKTINSQCKIVVYNWKTRDITSQPGDRELSEAERLDVSSQIRNFNYSKNMSQPSGTFQFTLTNSPGIGSGDWKDIIKRGDWCVIYLSQDGDLTLNPNVGPPLKVAQKQEEAKKIRCIGFIDRVAVRSSIDEKGAFDVEYIVSGRDFGVVYEDTSIWHNVFQFEQILLQSLASNELNITRNNSLQTVLDTVHDLFFNPENIPGARVNDTKSLTTIALQWLLPQQLVADVYGPNVNISDTYFGKLPDVKNFQPTQAALAVERPTDYLSGNAWEQLKKISVTTFHELFTETTELGRPQLTFRPIPFGIDSSKYPTLAKDVTLFKDLEPLVEVPAIEVKTFDLGEDNHSRYNSFLATVSTSLINTEDNISVLRDSDFPFFDQASIKRYGFRPMHVTVDSIIKNAQKDNGKSDRKLLIEFNELLKDYWQNYVYSESGSLAKTGSNNIKVGKALTFADQVPYLSKKRFYIEGYTDIFEIEENGSAYWHQDIILTRGFEIADLEDPNQSNFETRESPFSREGEFTNTGSGSNKKGNN